MDENGKIKCGNGLLNGVFTPTMELKFIKCTPIVPGLNNPFPGQYVLHQKYININTGECRWDQVEFEKE